jgi:DNA-binding CsgD family transcriptional regulator
VEKDGALPGLQTRVIAAMSRIEATIIERGPLTAQEAVVLRHLCEGRMRKEIAARVFRSYGCVSKQIDSIAEKLNAHSAAEIVAVAVAKGMVNIRFDHADRQAVLKCLLLAVLLVPQHIDSRQPPRHSRHPVQLVRSRAPAVGGRSWA